MTHSNDARTILCVVPSQLKPYVMHWILLPNVKSITMLFPGRACMLAVMCAAP